MDDKAFEAAVQAYSEAMGFGGQKLGRVLTEKRNAGIRAVITAYQAEASNPSDGLLMSMAVRYDHGLAVPGYYDEAIIGGKPGDHARRLISTISTMRQLHEEVTGAGFYRPCREEYYRAMMERALPPAPKASP